MIALDLEASGEETNALFCAASDSVRAIGDHHATAQLLANTLGDQEPRAEAQRRVITEAKTALGDSFDAVCARGRQMSSASLHAIPRENSPETDEPRRF